MNEFDEIAQSLNRVEARETEIERKIQAAEELGGAYLTALLLFCAYAAVAIACFVFGLEFGFDLARRGRVVIPLSTMQKQMHEIWKIPLHNLRPPQ